MTEGLLPGVRVSVVDYGLGNLFSIKQACEHAGMQVVVTSRKAEIFAADVVILPGVGAFGDAMATLRRLDLVSVLRDVADSGKPLVGVCLGMQLLMSEGYEFGVHKGLGIIEGTVVRFENPREEHHALKVPQVQWNQIWRARTDRERSDPWRNTPLDGFKDGEFMYFVHSFIVCPTDRSIVLSVSSYGHIEFCSSFLRGKVFGCQFHPERSGTQGLRIYSNIASVMKDKMRSWRTEDV